MTTRGSRNYIEHNIWKEKQRDGTAKYFTIHPETQAVTEIDSDQLYFWTDEWQAKEREADSDIEAGRVETFESMEAFLADLDTDDE